MSEQTGELYVYYKLRAEQAEAAGIAFETARAGAAGLRLLQRQEANAALLTWMEIYAPERPELEARIAAALAPFIEGERHSERFSELSPGRP